MSTAAHMAEVRSGSAPHDRIKLNVGGKYFETTVSTLQSGGPDSLLAALSSRSARDSNPIFIDRDPDIFAILLSLLRTNSLPSTALRRFSLQELADEALYYGVDSHFFSAVSPPPLRGFDAALIETLRPAADALPSTFIAAEDGSLWVAHGGQISVYDPYLSHSSTTRTHLDNVTSICRIWAEVAAVGSDSASGVHFYDLSGGRHLSSIHWTDPTDPRIYKAPVAAVTHSPNTLFASFECSHRENTVLVIDKSTLQVSSELGRQSGRSAKSTVPGKLTWLSETGLLIGSAVTCGAFGYSGYIRMWDPRNGKVVWETNEPGSGRSSRFGDSFADVDVDEEELTLFKVCSKSGDIAMADVRNLGEDPWVYMKDKNPTLTNPGGGRNSVIRCYKKQVFVGREGLEVWSKVEGCESGNGELLFRRNYVDKEEDAKRGLIRRIEGGGERLFLSREDMEGIEVWESSKFCAAVSLSSV